MAENDSEKYFVMFAADDVKELTLDQLDDAYRLDVIDDSTMIWQEGFEGWKTLSAVLAGDDDDAEEAEPVDDVSEWADVAGSQFQPQSSVQPQAARQMAQLTAPSFYPSGPASQQSYPAQQPQSFAQQSYAPQSQPAPSARPAAQYQAPSQFPTQPAPPPSHYPAQGYPQSQYPAQQAPRPQSFAPQSQYPAQSQYPGQGQFPAQSQHPSSSPYQTASQYPGQSQYPFAPASVAPNSLAPVAPPSIRGVAFDPDDLAFEPKTASPWFRRVLLVAAAAGALVVLQRGGVMHSLASAVDQGKSAEALEAKVLGSPAVDTPRGLDAKLKDIKSTYNLDHLSYTDPVADKAAQPSAAASDKPSSDSDSAKSASGSAAAPAANAPAAAKKADKAEPAKTENAFARALSGKPAPKAAPAARAGSARPASSAKHNSKLGVGTNGGDPNDPMNGKL